MKAPRPLLLSAILLAVVALGLTVHTVIGTPRALAQLARRHGDLLQLHGLSEHNADNRKALATYEATADGAPDLAAWSREHLPDLAVEITDRETLPLRTGWAVRRVDVRLADVTLDGVGQLLAGAEALRPPWRAVELQVNATGEAGRGQASLVMETVIRQNSGTTP